MQIWALVKYNAHHLRPTKQQLNTNVPFSLGQAQSHTESQLEPG